MSSGVADRFVSAAPRGQAQVALCVDSVLGVRELDALEKPELRPLRQSASRDLIDA